LFRFSYDFRSLWKYFRRLPAGTAATATTIAAAPAAPATAGTTTATAVAAPAATATCGLGTRFIHVQCTAIQLSAVELRDSGQCITLFRHLNECEAAGLPSVTVGHDTDALNIAIRSERRIQFILRRLITQISDKNVCQRIVPYSTNEMELSLSDSAGIQH
jgi:hypothetical protein